MARTNSLGPFFYPESIAIVGASRDETKPSGIILKNLLNSFQGRIYPVNPKYSELHGIPCFPSVSAIKEDISLSVLITPPSIIPGILKEHAGRGIHHVIISSAGFGETEAGVELEKEIKEIAGHSGIRIIGPNCLGIFHPSVGLDTFFLPYDRVRRPGKGHISIISQSGSILGVTMMLLEDEGLGIAKAVSYGNRADVGETDLIEYLSADDETTVIGLCMESVSEGRGFIHAVQGCRKPVVALKLGQGPAGKKAARSHTGSIAGRYDIFQAAFRRCGIYEARTLEEFLDMLKVLAIQRSGQGSGQRPREGRQVLIVTNAGGVSVMTADLCNKEGLEVPDLPPEPRERLRKLLPPYYSLSNPVDLTGNSTDDQFALVLRTCIDYFDAAILIPFMTVPGVTPDLGDAIIQSIQHCRRPVISLCPFAEDGEKLKGSFNQYGIPLLPTPARVVRALAHLLKERHVDPLPDKMRDFFASLNESTVIERSEKSTAPEVISILKDAKRKGLNLLSHGDKYRLLDALGLKYPRSISAKNQSEAISAAHSIGLPVALKISSPDIIHRTDAGGVRLNIRSIKELRKAYKEVIGSAKGHIPGARIVGVDVEEMAPPGLEIIIGGIKDQQFGPVVMFGLGGVFVEVIKDVAFEIAPVTYNGARGMLESIKGYPILKGVRGIEGVDIDAIAKAIVIVSEVISGCPEIGEIEFNPAIACPSGIIVVDARIILE